MAVDYCRAVRRVATRPNQSRSSEAPVFAVACEQYAVTRAQIWRANRPPGGDGLSNRYAPCDQAPHHRTYRRDAENIDPLKRQRILAMTDDWFEDGRLAWLALDAYTTGAGCGTVLRDR